MAEKAQPRAQSTKPSTATTSERRKRLALRRLIDEMLAEIRAAASEENWTADARAQAESDLARIMAQVRQEAMRGAPKSKPKRTKAD
jgi:hypothetical protein